MYKRPVSLSPIEHGAVLARRSRAEQQLPEHIEDAGALATIAALLEAERDDLARHEAEAARDVPEAKAS